MFFVDTHCHLDFEAFDADRAEVIARAVAAGVTRLIIPAVDLANSAAALALATGYPGVYAAVGIHPNSTAVCPAEWLSALRALAGQPGVVAIGEIGLDYYWQESPPAIQQAALAAQLALAAELNLPVIIHNREAGPDVIHALTESPAARRERAGVLHSFSADRELARQALDLGFYLGFTGPLTYKNADDLRAVAAFAPLDRLLLETDAPFLPPQPRRGRRNEPAYVIYVAERLAALRGCSLEAIAAATTANALRLFGLAADGETG